MIFKIDKARLAAPVIVAYTIFVVAFGFYMNVLDAYAGGNAYNPVSPTNPGCSSICYDQHGMGVAWIFYPFSSAYGYDAGSQTVNAPNTHAGNLSVSNCIAAGASGYYRLGWVWYYKSNHKPAVVNGVYQYGYFKASDVMNEGGGALYYTGAYGSIGSEDWATVRNNFNIAKENNATQGLTWPDVSMFCFNPEWKVEEKTGGGSFRAKSAVQVEANAAGHVPAIPKQTSDWNKSVYATFSTDVDNVTVHFSHIMDYTNKNVDWTELGHGHDIVNSPTSNWTVTATNSTGGGSGAYSPNARIAKETSTGDSTQYDNSSVTVNVPEGETVTACSKIKYQPSVTFKSKTTPEQYYYSCSRWGCTKVTTHEEYKTWTPDAASGSATSEACVEITHPKDPSGYTWSGSDGGSFGAGSVNPMFAGEHAGIGWNVSGLHYPTRRLEGYKAVVFNYLPDAYRASNGAGAWEADKRSDSDPCGYFGARSAQNCQVIDSIEKSGHNAAHSLNASRDAVVPDPVGTKYCTSFGYHYESFYGTRQGSSGDYSWTPTGYNYWYDFSASCRTIAKKPSTAVWNGSMMSTGNVITSLSPRFNSADMGKVTSAGGAMTLYGSWAEYMAVVKSTMDKDRALGSGASLSNGSPTTLNATSKLCNSSGEPWNTNSPLTIANVGCNIGGSGIGANSTFMTRLEAYLKNKATVLSSPSSGMTAGKSETKLYRTTGTLKLTGNITLADDAYTTHNMPQVVIFVDGDLEISKDVSRIDAWLIVSGSVRTCQDFSGGSTESDAGATAKDCGAQLAFNGPVIVQGKLDLRRSFGSDLYVTRTGTFGMASSKQAPAEIFNLRADTYLWAYTQAARYSSSYKEVYSRELAPRY